MSKKDKVKKEEIENVEEQQAEDSKEETQEEVVELSKEEELEIQVKEATDKYLRLYSEFDNFRKRTQKEKIELYKTAGEGVITAILPVLDDFERAEKANQESDDAQVIKDGFKLIQDKLTNTLKTKGLEAVESPVGKDFNVEFHEAITQIPAPSKKEKGKVLDVVEKGYELNGKVIRFTKVVIGQ
ncbi:MAG: nucleotide exchange factor GrpE [Flavobacteriales bacterium]|nr:MAG: nucleotide exchange factor GrpE [Flavobacteriales bacterium]